MMQNNGFFCMGVECSIRKMCQHYIDGLQRDVNDGEDSSRWRRRCINQKRFLRRED